MSGEVSYAGQLGHFPNGNRVYVRSTLQVNIIGGVHAWAMRPKTVTYAVGDLERYKT